ncbi:MAG: acyloxyacyl hydrolase [Vicingaceae bacterium]
MIKVHHKYFLGVLISFLFVKGFSQSEMQGVEFTPQKNNTLFSVGVKATFHHGAILPHRKEVSEVIEGHTQAYEISFNKNTAGKKTWQQLYGCPKVGISALYMSLGNPNELGSSFGLFPFVELPVNQRKIQWMFKLGYGLGYIQKPYDRETNRKNIAIGSKVNAIIYANTNWEVKLSDKINSSLGLSLIHFSNGSFARPNLGLNIFSINTGLTYNFGKEESYTNNKVEKRERTWSKNIIVGFGLKEVPPVGGGKYFVSSYSFNLIKIRAEKSSFGFGADVFYNTSLSGLIERNSPGKSNGLDNFRLGLMGLYTFDFGKISVLVGLGGYAVANYKKDGLIYNRLGTRFRVSDHLFLRLGMKTHVAVADFVDYGIGYRF